MSASLPRGYVAIQDVVDLLQKAVKDRKDTFTIKNKMVECDIGGSFTPTCGEMHAFSSILWNKEKIAVISPPGEPIGFILGDIHEFGNASLRCYYECLLRGSNISHIIPRVFARGHFEISILVQNRKIRKVAAQCKANFGDSPAELDLAPICLGDLPRNGSLCLRVRAMDDESIFYGFRWIGLTPETTANFGERIYLIRTYGCRQLVMNWLKMLTDKLARDNPRVLRRSLFIIYDAKDEWNTMAEAELCPGARVLELAGPNCGGGGNASFLVSLCLRLPESVQENVSDLILIDDDAKIDAESIVRHDSFVTARKPDVISAAIIYKSDNPVEVQEYGGIWGKFFSKTNHRTSPDLDPRNCTMFPYLPRYGVDISRIENCIALGGHYDVDYSTFIFISFPYAVFAKIGAPYPFFLRNDDVEICLRAKARGASLIINSNLQAWHRQRETPTAEFYAALHGLILNYARNCMADEYALITMLGRISSLARVGNRVLLFADMLALQAYARGPEWMQAESIFGFYQSVTKRISEFQQKTLYIIPREVVDEHADELTVINFTDNTPITPDKDKIVFFDVANDAYYGQSVCADLPSTQAMLADCVNSLSTIAENRDLQKAWERQLSEFDHKSFWDRVFATEKLDLQNWRPGDAAELESPCCKPVPDLSAKELWQQAGTQIPPDFSETGYLVNNPDVAKSGISPIHHWLKYGRFEGRIYRFEKKA